MRRELLIYTCLLFIVTGSASQAQDVKKDLASMRKVYRETKQLSMNIEYSVHLDNNMTTPYEKEMAVYKKDGDLFYMKQMGTEIISNAKCVTIIDHERKLVMIDKTGKTENAPWNIPLDSLLPLYKDAKYYAPASRPDLKAYTLHFNEGAYKTIDIWFNAKTFLIEKIQMQYRNKIEENDAMHDVTMIMRFNDINTRPKFTPSTFSESGYVQEIKGKHELKPAYKSYTLVNHLNTKK